ncbi:MAG: immunoglobulin domain-containing protein [Phycisphaerales bacterium]|nr:immunoglobulin domain-containing protein [Phycisphaerales bacterium]
MNTRIISERTRLQGGRIGPFFASVCTVALTCLAQPGYSQCGGQWLRTTDQAGLRGQSRVLAMTRWFGNGRDNPEWLVLGGQLNQIIDGVQYYSVVGYSGGQWLAMDSLPRNVNTLITSAERSTLYAGIDYVAGAGQPASTVMQLLHSSLTWQPIGRLTGPTHALAFSTDGFYAGGEFTMADGQTVEHIVRWNGSSWVPLPGGGTDGPVRALAVYNGKLIVAGDFSYAGGSPAANIAQWDGGVWSPLGAGTNGLVRTLTTHGTSLVAGGHFTQAGGQNAARIARWNGTSWSAFGSGFNNRVWTVMSSINGWLYAGGQFTASGARPLNRMAAWDPWTSTWLPLDEGADNVVAAITDYYPYVVAGGYFDHVDGLPTRAVVQRRFGEWSTLGVGFRGYDFEPSVYAMTTFRGQPHAGGLFSFENGNLASSLAAWNGLTWQEVSGGVTDDGRAEYVTALNTVPGGGFPVQTELVVGGRFNRVGGDPGSFYSTAAENIATYSREYGHPDWDALGAGLPGCWVFDVTVYNNETIAAGHYEDPDGYGDSGFVARWNGSEWQRLGGIGIGNWGIGVVYAVAVYAGQLYAGGNFLSADGNSCDAIARWNGTNWEPLSSGLSSSTWSMVRAMEVFDGELVVAGAFDSAGGAEAGSIASWNGVAWTPLGAGMNRQASETPIWALAVYNGDLIAGGEFQQAGDRECLRIARWNGIDWQPLGPGLSGDGNYGNRVTAVCVSNGELFVGGSFSRAGNVIAHNWARWTDTNTPWIALQEPAAGSQTRVCGGVFTASVTAAMGYDGLTYQWQRNGVPLANGMSPTGSVISGANARQLTISNLRGGDRGSYTVLVSNICGNVASKPMTLTVTGNCAGGLNGDDPIDLFDLAIDLSRFDGSAGCDVQSGDIDGDGLVTLDDFAALLTEYGTSSP